MDLTTTSFAPDRLRQARLGGSCHPFRQRQPGPGVVRRAPGDQVIRPDCHDRDVPSVGDDVNQEDREVPPDLPRVDFFHWVVVDLPSDMRSIDEGEFARGVVAGGRQAKEGPHGSRQGLNDFTGWFSGDPDMEDKYYGYDGPAPPWNDSVIHHYVFTLYALDIEELPVEGEFTGPEVRDAIEGHVLAEASVTGTYTQNPRLVH